MKSLSPLGVCLLTLAPLAQAQTAPAAPLTQERCGALASLVVAPSRIALPTGGARITEAKSVAAGGPVVAHCLVSGEIAPIDPKAPPIRFSLALPVAWNGKMLMIGGGGFNGTVPAVTSPAYAGRPDAVPPLTRGYAIFGSDSGHKDNPLAPGDFMTNAEALRNYLGDSLKKTRDTALAIVVAAYGQAPTRSYFIGGSTGGREAVWVAGRWPGDWDGVVSLYPARDLTTLVIGAHNINRAMSLPGAYVSPAKRRVLYDAALEMCDGLDGLKDGIISDVATCNRRFVPSRATLHGQPLRCPEGADTGEDCLSDTQLKALALMQSAQRARYRLASGITEFGGYNAYTSDLGIGTDTPTDKVLQFFGLGAVAPAFPAKSGMSLAALYGDSFVRFGWVGDASINPLTVDPLNPGKYGARISEISAVDSLDRDLTRFARHGGKLLVMHGTADAVVSPRLTERYYARLRKTMSPKSVDSFLRFYEVPGFSHGNSNTFNAGWDFLSALENWAELGKDPGETEVVIDKSVVAGRTRPLCRYPRWPRYNGTGDVNSAASFTCATTRR